MDSTIERKCSNCGQWNGAEDYCKKCNSPISIKVIEAIETVEKKRIEAKKPEDKFDIWLNKVRHHRFFLIRFIFYIFYSVWIVFMGIGSFVAWLTAWSVG